jgi:predicted nucleotide-binding protein (sugar kinase/HSP70/actin superfamily)
LRLEREAGVEDKRIQHFARPKENPFTKAQRDSTTILFGGLTWKHEKLLHGALEGLGYKCEPLPVPNVKAFQTGKEFGNNGQCNPTYFTVGNLVQFLQGLERQGLSKPEIIDRYVFFTAGACGPCRFGMYEAEYRLALRNSGFDGFRVLLFQQSGGLNQAEIEAGLELNLEFFLAILNALNMGDILNDVAYQIRPYEVHKGETDRVLEEVMDYLHEVMKNTKAFRIEESKLKKFVGRLDGAADYLGKFLKQLYRDDYMAALRHVRDRFNSIQVDRTRAKPTVKITGEFWAQTTEGDGNFNMFRFLEREGAQVMVEPIGTWINYLITQAKQAAIDRKGLDLDGKVQEVEAKSWREKLAAEIDFKKKAALLTIAEKVFRREYRRIVEALGGLAHDLADQYELQRVAHPFYNSRSGGGEGHLEVAKNIYYSNRGLAHMVLSLKPFGCMPSTQSDGAQSAVVGLYKDMIYLPIETSGEGEINAHSRVQMALGEAKAKCKAEYKEVLEATGYTIDEIRAYVEAHDELQRPMYRVPHYRGVVGTGAAFIKHVGERMRAEAVAPQAKAAAAVA